MVQTKNNPKEDQTTTRQTRSNHKDTNIKSSKGINILFGGNTISIKVHQKRISTNGYTQRRQIWKEKDSNEKTNTPIPDISLDCVEANIEFASQRQIGRGSKKLARNRETNTPGKPNLRLHVDVMTEEQLEQALGTIKENPTATKIVENTGNENKIETETNVIENQIRNVIETDNQIQNRSSRKRSNNPIVRFGNPVTQ